MPALTDRQRQVLCLVALSNREMAVRLGISQQTVKNLLRRAYRRLGVAGPATGKRIPALMVTLRWGIVTLDEVEPPSQVPLVWDRERFAQAHGAAWRASHAG